MAMDDERISEEVVAIVLTVGVKEGDGGGRA